MKDNPPDDLAHLLSLYEARFLDTVNMVGVGRELLIQQIKHALEFGEKIPEPPDNVKL